VKHSQTYAADDFARDTHVSRETLDRLKIYADLLLRWTKKINLIAKSTESEVWRRHFLDSAQLFPIIPESTKTLVDMGSGAGFPGLVLAVMGVHGVHLIESDQRKATFLREAARETGTAVTVHAKRAEAVAPFPADVITARALAPVADLLALGERFVTPATQYVLLKGQNVEVELTQAHKMWTIHVNSRASLSDPEGNVLCLSEVCRVRPD